MVDLPSSHNTATKEKDKKVVDYRPDMKLEVIARAIVIIDGNVLLQRNVQRDDFALPGGHIEKGETVKQSLIRELKEETGLDIEPGKLVYVNENFFEQDGEEFHEIGLYFQARIISEIGDKIESKESHIDFWFIGLDSLPQMNVYPSFLKPNLPEDARLDFSGPVKHVVQTGDKFRIE